jgi:hypothetical protein
MLHVVRVSFFRIALTATEQILGAMTMSKSRRRFVAKAEKGLGWRIWDNMQLQFWGPVFARQPTAVVAELNGAKRGAQLDKLVALAKGQGK